jgi:hypothetical protein
MDAWLPRPAAGRDERSVTSGHGCPAGAAPYLNRVRRMLMFQDYRRLGVDLRTFRLQPWKLWLLAAAAVVLALTFFIVAASLLVILAPVVLVGGLVAKLLLGGGNAVRRNPPARGGVIEGCYEVIDSGDRDRRR